MTVDESTLDRIGLDCGTDKASHHHDYLRFYEQHLRAHRDKRFILVEIGVHKGQSLAMWAQYFENARVVGIDISEDARHVVHRENACVRIGDASRLEVLDDVIAEFGRPFVVLDDGSHRWDHQIETLRYLWPRLLPGGFFIVEDVHTSFPAMADQYRVLSSSSFTAFDYLSKLNRWVVGSGSMGSERADDGFIANYYDTVHSMMWYRGTCLLQKK